MDASCFLASKSFSKTLELVHPVKVSLPLRSSSQHVHRRRTRGQVQSPPSIRCNMRSSASSDEDDNITINSDWRSFRARLVAGEQPTRLGLSPQPNPAHGDKWAHPIHEPEKGCLLVASEKLDGVHIFERTVILLLSTGPTGPTGIILNRPSLMSIKETRSTGLDSAGVFSDRPLFFGGPLEEGVFLVANSHVGRSGVFEEVMEGVYYGGKESVGCAAEMVKRKVVGVEEFGFFDGCCGWEREQLKEEIGGGYWSVVACGAGVVGTRGVGMWDEVMGLVGHRKVW